MSETIRTRAEIPAKYKWNAASVYPSDKAWEAETDSLLIKLDELKLIEGSIGKSATNLADALDQSNALLEVLGKSEMQFDRDRTGITWATFSHLYQDYYVYQYSTGISGAHALSRRILSGTPNAAEEYLRFLSAGSSVYPLDALKLAGVDMSTPQPVEETFEILSQMVDRLEELSKVRQ